MTLFADWLKMDQHTADGSLLWMSPPPSLGYTTDYLVTGARQSPPTPSPALTSDFTISDGSLSATIGVHDGRWALSRLGGPGLNETLEGPVD